MKYTVCALAVIITAGLIATTMTEAHAEEEQQSIPDWVKQVAGFWAAGDISDEQYAGTLSYLAAEGFITVPAAEPEPTCEEAFDTTLLYGMAATGVILATATSSDAGSLDMFIDLQTKYMKASMEALDIINSDRCPGISAAQELLYDNMLDAFKYAQNVRDAPTGTQCSLFCDSTGYEPQWAKTMGENQALSKCTTLVANEYGTSDSDWCIEFSGYLMDKLN